MGKKTRNLLLVGLGIILIGSIVVAVVLNNKPYTVLFTELTNSDVSAILTYLNDNGITNYRLENGDTILVPESQESIIKSKVLMAGYPQSGFSYSTYYAHVGSMTTESERSTAFLYELQDRMAATIRCLEGVKDAIVNIDMGEDNSSILFPENEIKATASVTVIMRDGRKLSEQQAAAIRNLVARAVRGLEFDQVGIVDSMGNIYSGEDGMGSALDASQLKLNLESEWNNRIRTEIMQVLIPLFGAENVRVSVNSTVDISRSVGESTTYQLPEGAVDGEGLLGTKIFEQELVRGGGDTAGGAVGTGTNSDVPNYIQGQLDNAGEDSTYIYNSGEEDHKLNESKEQVERVAGYISDIMVAVSINSTTAGDINTGTLRTHVARAAGIGREVEGDKISILPWAFYEPPGVVTPDPIGDGLNLSMWMIYAAGGGLLLLLLLIILFSLLLRRRRKRKGRELQAMLEAPAAPGAGGQEREGADLMELQTEKSMELRKDIREFAESSPEIAAQMIKGWLKGEGSGNG